MRYGGQEDRFWVGSDGGIMTSWSIEQGPWQGPLEITNPSTSHAKPGGGIAAAARNFTQEDVFWVGSDGGVWTTSETNDGPWQYNPWEITHPAQTPQYDGMPGGGIAAAARYAAQEDVFWVGSDGQVVTTFETNGPWQNPLAITIAGQAMYGGGIAAAVRGVYDGPPGGPGGQEDVFWVGGNGRVMTTFEVYNKAWQYTPWLVTTTGASAGNSIAATESYSITRGDNEDVFVVRDDGSVAETYTTGGPWSAPSTLYPAGFTSAGAGIAVVYVGFEELELTVSPGIGIFNRRVPYLSTVSLVASTNWAVIGQAVTLSATVQGNQPGTAPPPTGTVTFRDGGTTLGTAILANGTGSLTVPMTALGEHAITVSYSGDANSAPAATGVVTTAASAGTTTAGPGLSPEGMAADAAGDLFIADTLNNRIRELVKATGALVTVAGDGVAGYLGDGGPAIYAWLDGPTGVALDAAGDLFIADRGNDVVREVVKATGVIRTVAGDGTPGYFGDGGWATNAWLDGPTGVAVDAAGDLFIADSLNDRIREVIKATGRIITVAGSGTAGSGGDGGPARAAALDRPERVAVDGAGDLLIADTGNDRIREVVKATGMIRTVAGDGAAGSGGDGGLATAAALDGPSDVAVDAAGDLFIADSLNNRIREVDTSGIIRTVAGSGTAGFGGDDQPATAAELSGPVGVALDASGHLFIADTGNDRIREVIVPAPIIVGRDATTTSLTASTVSAGYGQAVTFTAWVGISGPSVGVPTGTVTFYDGRTALGTVALGGTTLATLQATFTTSSLAVGTHAITAVYNGDADDSPSGSATVTVTVTSPVIGPSPSPLTSAMAAGPAIGSSRAAAVTRPLGPTLRTAVTPGPHTTASTRMGLAGFLVGRSLSETESGVGLIISGEGGPLGNAISGRHPCLSRTSRTAGPGPSSGAGSRPAPRAVQGRAKTSLGRSARPCFASHAAASAGLPHAL
jgi:hypothetical protein